MRRYGVRIKGCVVDTYHGQLLEEPKVVELAELFRVAAAPVRRSHAGERSPTPVPMHGP